MNDRDRQRQHILTALAVEWDKHPNLRFGQLVENLIQSSFVDNSEDHWKHCIFHVSDGDAERLILAGIVSNAEPAAPLSPWEEAIAERIMEALT